MVRYPNQPQNFLVAKPFYIGPTTELLGIDKVANRAGRVPLVEQLQGHDKSMTNLRDMGRLIQS